MTAHYTKILIEVEDVAVCQPVPTNRPLQDEAEAAIGFHGFRQMSAKQYACRENLGVFCKVAIRGVAGIKDLLPFFEVFFFVEHLQGSAGKPDGKAVVVGRIGDGVTLVGQYSLNRAGDDVLVCCCIVLVRASPCLVGLDCECHQDVITLQLDVAALYFLRQAPGDMQRPSGIARIDGFDAIEHGLDGAHDLDGPEHVERDPTQRVHELPLLVGALTVHVVWLR
mmetsp:Transcript_17878/g.50677  ORF Transcript_17878/g.50677 Transcript_17878/m.50677 type:complete len:224 (-) Transcript_17878:974-1645(-)